MLRSLMRAARGVLVFGVLALMAIFAASGAHAAQGNVDLPRFPSVSPDGTQVVFSWRGDLWKVPTAGGLATRMTSHPGDDLRSAWSKDGKRIAFDSSRDGYTNLYIMNADGTGVTQITHMDRPSELIGFGTDNDGNAALMFDGTMEGDVFRSDRPYMISTAGGDPQRVHDAFGWHAAVSPDGNTVAFTRGGYYYGWERRHYMGPEAMDIWTFDRKGNSFKQLSTWAGNDGDAKWGGPRTLVYMSDRNDNCVNLYRMSATDGDKTTARLTNFTENDVQAFDVSADGKTVVFTVWDTMYSLNLDDPNAKPKAITITANEDEADNYELKNVRREVSEAALSPDGQVMAMIAYGELYVRNVDEKSPTRRIVMGESHETNPVWSPDGLKLYFVSDKEGSNNIYVATVELTRKEARDGFKKLEEAKKDDADDDDDDEADDEDEDGDDDADDDEDEDDPNAKFYDPSRWHDAVTFKVEPFIVNEHENYEPSFSPDGKWLSYRRDLGDIILYEMATGTEREFVTGWETDLEWTWAPDSKHIAYVQSDLDYNADIWIKPIDDSAPAMNVTKHPDNEGSPRWSADGKILAFVSERVNEEFDVWMVYLDKELESLTPKELDQYYKDAADAAKKRKPVKVDKPKKEKKEEAKDEDAKDNDEAKADGEEAKDDDDAKKDDKKDSDKKKDEKADEPPPPLVLDLDDAYMRVHRVTNLPGNEGSLLLSPGGDMYVFSADTGDSSGLFSMKWNGEDRKRISGRVSPQHLTLTGDKIVFVGDGRAGTVKITGGDSEYYDLDDQMRIDLQAQSAQKFVEASRTLGQIFYDENMKGLDWKALTQKYLQLAKQARTADEFNYIANRFIGELNASHLGIRAPSPSAPGRQASGRIGIHEERVANGFRVKEIIPDSPASRGEMALHVGDVITAIDFQPVEPDQTLDEMLEGKVGTETAFTIERTLDDGATATLTALITPVGFGELRGLIYAAWQKHNAKLVDEWSNGRIGYIHMEGMSQPSLDEFERDLFAAADGKDGLLLDVRNNGGGWTTDRVLSSIMVQEHAYTLPRGVGHDKRGHYPQDRLFIQRYTMPMNLLCNEKSFSNAEIMSHAFKTLKRGTLVGQETYGGVISTGGTALIDGTFVRLPLRGWFLPDGTDMELHGARPDIIVEQTPEDESAENDAQLRAAVDDLMKRLK